MSRASVLVCLDAIASWTRYGKAAAGVAAGRGQAMLVAGDAGIGKSRLVRELAARLEQDGWVVLQGNCFERDRALPYGPVAELLRNTLGSEPPPTVVEQLGPRAVDLVTGAPGAHPLAAGGPRTGADRSRAGSLAPFPGG